MWGIGWWKGGGLGKVLIPIKKLVNINLILDVKNERIIRNLICKKNKNSKYNNIFVKWKH